MFKKIIFTMTIILISVILLTHSDCFARGGGGRGGRGGGMMGGGMMGGGMMGGQMDPGMGRGGFNQTPIDVNNFRTSVLLTYIVDANDKKVDPNSLSNETLQNLLEQIGRGNRDVIDLTRFNELTQVRGTIMGQPEYDPNDPDPMISVNLNGLTINAIIEMLIRWTGKAVLPSNDSLGLTITVFSPERMRKSEALNLLYSAMREQGFVAETRNNIIYILPAALSTQIYAPLLSPDEELATYKDTQEIVRKIFKIKNYSPSTIGQLILSFLNPTARVTAEETTQTLMVMDTVETLIQVEKIIEQFDKKLADTVTEILKVQHSEPTELANTISQIMANNIVSSGMLTGGFNMGGMMGGISMQPTSRTSSQTTRTSGTNTRTSTTTTRSTNDRTSRGTTTTSSSGGRRPTSTTQGGMMSMGMFGATSASASTIGTGKPEPILIPDTINKIIIATATPEDMITIKKWLYELDTDTKVVWNPKDLSTLAENLVVQKIYRLQYNTPEQLAQILEPLLTQDGYLSAESNTGTLLIRDTVGTLKQLEEIIREFDKEEAQPDMQQIFVVKNGDPQEIVRIINMILNGQGGATGTRTTGFATGTRTTGTRTTGTRTTGTRTTGRTTGRTGMGF